MIKKFTELNSFNDDRLFDFMIQNNCSQTLKLSGIHRVNMPIEFMATFKDEKINRKMFSEISFEIDRDCGIKTIKVDDRDNSLIFIEVIPFEKNEIENDAY